MSPNNPIPGFIREITELNLTKWGQIKLCGFPEAAIVDARKGLKLSKQARDPFALFFKIALDYCNNNNLHVMWKAVDLLKETYKMPENAPMVIAPGTKVPGPKSFEELSRTVQERSLEDNFTAALKIARHYKNNALNGIENPWWNRLQKAEQDRIMDIINKENNLGTP